MDDISKLLQEAKPLYLARKKRNNRIKSAAALSVCIVAVLFAVPRSPQVYPAYTYGEWLDEQLYQTAEGSVIEEMGLPVDEYGLLKVI